MLEEKPASHIRKFAGSMGSFSRSVIVRCVVIESIGGRVLACVQGVRAALRPIKGCDFTPLYLASALSIPLAPKADN